MLIWGLDGKQTFLYNHVTVLHKTSMTVTTNDRGQQNMWAKEPTMYVAESDAKKYALETYAEKAEKLNSMYAMLGIVAGFISYFFTGKLFFGIF